MNHKNILIKILMALFLLLSGPSAVWAQEPEYVPTPCQSRWTDYVPVKEGNSIVRSEANYRVVHTQYEDQTTGQVSHTFVIKDYYSGVETALSTNFNTVYPVYITDMRLYGGICYFCGRVETDVVNWSGIPTTYGIVGRFSPQALPLGLGDLQFRWVTEVSQFTRLAVTNSNQWPLISLIGLKEGQNTSCMVELKQTGATTWEMYLDDLTMPGGVFFSDILNTGDSLTLLVQWECANNYPPGYIDYDTRHQIFMLDRFSKNGCHNDISPLTMHYMAHYTIPDDSYCKFHYNKCQMRLSRINDYYYGFCVAFGVEESVENMGGIRLFPFSNPWNIDSCIYYRTGVHSVVKDLSNLLGTGQLLAVTEDVSHNEGLVSLPTLGSASHDVPWLVGTGNGYSSIAQNTNAISTNIDITGHNSSWIYRMFQQDIFELDMPSCFYVQNHHYSVFPELKPAILVVVWNSKEYAFSKWEKADLFEIDLETEDVCKKCGDNY